MAEGFDSGDVEMREANDIHVSAEGPDATSSRKIDTTKTSKGTEGMSLGGDSGGNEWKDESSIEDSEDLSPEEKMTFGLSCKDAGNECLKSEEYLSARDKYKEGSKYVKNLNCHGAPDIQKALYTNLALAHNKLGEWNEAKEAATSALAIEPNNVKALYRRGIALSNRGFLEQSKQDFLRVLALEPANSGARNELTAVRQKIVEAKAQTKKAYGGMFSRTSGTLYADREAELKLREQLNEEKRQAEVEEWTKLNAERKEKGEKEISFESWTEEKQEKKRAEEEYERKRKESTERKNASKKSERTGGSKGPTRANDYAKSNSASSEADLDEEDRKILAETKSKGYCYFHRELTEEEKRQKLLFAPTRIDSAASPTSNGSGSEPSASGLSTESTGNTTRTQSASSQQSISSWNKKGTTWEESDKTALAKEQLKSRLSKSIRVVHSPLDNFSSSSPESMQEKLSQLLSVIGPDGRASKSPQETLSTISELSSSYIPMEGKITKVHSIEGEASVAMVSGTKRFLYDFEIQLSWEVTMQDFGGLSQGLGKDSKNESETTCFTGGVTFYDVSSTRAGGKHWSEEAKWTYKNKPAEAHLQNALQKMFEKLRIAIVKEVETFEAEFRSR